MNAKVSRTKWLRTLGNLSYLFGIALIIASLLVNAVPARPAFAQNNGAIWTTTGSCGTPQNSNHYQSGGHVFINGSGFAADKYDWNIKGKPGGASGDPGDKVASGSETVDAAGAFCFDAYTIQADDWGEYQAKFGNKSDNYNVTAPAATPLPPTDTPTNAPTNTPTDTPDTPVLSEPTATPTDTPTQTPMGPSTTPTETQVPGGPTNTPSDSPTGTPADPTQTATVTTAPTGLLVSSYCGANSEHINSWKISNPSGYTVAVTWEIMPSGAPSDTASVPASGEYQLSTEKVTGHDTLVVYFDPQGQSIAGSASAALDCGTDKGQPNDTTPGGNPGPALAVLPAFPAGQVQVLIPVTGADLSSSSRTRGLFFSLGVGFLGLGLVLNGLARERRDRDI